MMKATSKNTGMATKNPVAISAQEAPLSLAFFNRNPATDSAPPECSRMAPNIAPNPTTTATNPKVLPIPVCMVSTMAIGSMPARIPTKMLTMSKAINACMRSFRMRNNKTAMPNAILKSKLLSMVVPI